MMHEGSDLQIRKRINDALSGEETARLSALRQFTTAKFHSFSITDESLDTILIQFRALGLIEMSRSKKARSVSDRSAYWTLTPYGDSIMTRLRAIHRRPVSLLPDDAVEDDEPSAMDSV